ncbi:saccharopine dehydrogenase NADP-binding domain-containing protein [Infirmifilum uzonense]|uniref:saccharopine dehydrogenase family protein n=1 Tax=Infirmifilum uzonense TaxID=1550241 RepID=UPI003C73D71F
MRLAILGCGAVGSVVARLALKHRVADEVTCFDRNLERARMFLDFEDSHDIPVEEADAINSEMLSSKLSGYDFVVNTLPTFVRINEREKLLNPIVMQASLKAGVPYMDLACYGGRRRTAEQLALSAAFRREHNLAIINAGASPGLTNLLAREAYEDLDKVFSIKVMSLEDQKGPSFLISWSREEMLNVATPVLVYRNRRYAFIEPFSESIECNFPAPEGSVRCYPVSNDESYTIPVYLRTQDFDYYAGGSDIEILRALYRLGVLEEKTLIVRGKRVSLRSLLYQILKEPSSPRSYLSAIEEGELEDAFFAVGVVAIGEISGEKGLSSRSVFFPSQRRVNNLLPGATYITYPTALVVIALLQSLKGRNLHGVFPLEALPGVVRRNVLETLEEHKIFVNREFKVEEK